ncbi:uncharacterized protein LOC126889540 [Diabrotica virgifera virgifera]|uniref:Uncharacterized protein n=1 Tax=Diabrotica virgifera virgifera TaxID=50390 RepID=A0ABM5KUI5_DIAVI|nr:uncharacterized protein LOC126889540 [Diabrotica virgifera virgifera]
MQTDYLRKLLLETPDVVRKIFIEAENNWGFRSIRNSVRLGFYSKVQTILDIYTYLVESRSCYSKQQMKAYKSLQAHKYFTAGFVLNGVKIVNDFLISILLLER